MSKRKPKPKRVTISGKKVWFSVTKKLDHVIDAATKKPGNHRKAKRK